MSTHRTRRARGAALLATATIVAASLAACSSDDDDGDGGGGGDADKITVWIEEDLPDRVAATQAIVDAFTAESGIEVELVAVAEDQFNQILTSNAAAGELPDVMGGIPLGQIRTLSANELLDTDAVGDVLDSLGTDTFSESALELTSDGDDPLAIPSESWVQLLVYRKDLFEAAGLAAPETYDDVLAAAEALDSADVAGFVGANVAGDAFTAQTFEEIGLGNGCELVDDERRGHLRQRRVRRGAGLLRPAPAGLLGHRRPGRRHHAGVVLRRPGRDADLVELHPRRDGRAAERRAADLPGVRVPTRRSWPRTAAWSPRSRDPSGDEPATFGEVTSWTIPAESATDPAKEFVEYMMTDGYEPWIAIAPEGKIPVRAGEQAPTRRSTPTPGPAWRSAWTPRRRSRSSTARTSSTRSPRAPTHCSRWAIPQGQGDLLGAIQGEQPVANAVNEVANGTSRRRRGAAGRRRDPRGCRTRSDHQRTAPRRGDGRGTGPGAARPEATGGGGPPGPARTAGPATC